MTDPSVTRRAWAAAALDVVVVVAFVVIGRRSHDEGGSVVGEALEVAAPFLIALAAGWVVARAWESPGEPAPTGVVVWLVTVIAGLVLRRFLFEGGTAVPFIIVTSLFLLAGLVGWRAGAQWRDNRVTPNP